MVPGLSASSAASSSWEPLSVEPELQPPVTTRRAYRPDDAVEDNLPREALLVPPGPECVRGKAGPHPEWGDGSTAARPRGKLSKEGAFVCIPEAKASCCISS